MAVQLASAMTEAAGKKEAPVAVRAAVGVLKQDMVTDPISEAVSFRTEEFLATAMGTTRG